MGWAAVAALALAAGCRGGSDPVLARVGRHAIRESEFRRKLFEVPPEYQAYVMTPLGRRQFLDVLIREKLILAAAADAGIHRTPEFRARWDELRSDEARKLAEGKDYLLTQLWIQDLRAKGVLGASEEDVRRYHQKHPNEVEVRHALLATPEEAEAVVRKVRAGASLAELAKASSIDAETAPQGGRMRPVLYGEIIPELEDVVFQIKVGELAGPVRSKFGYHVLRKESERALPFDKAKDRIRTVLEKQRLDRHLQALQPRYPVEVIDAQFN